MTQPMRPIATSIPADDHDALLRLCEQTGRSMSAEIAHAIRRHVAQPPRLAVPDLRPASTGDVPRRRPGRPAKKS